MITLTKKNEEIETNVVESAQKSCDCRSFIITKLPCHHLIYLHHQKIIELTENSIPGHYKVKDVAKQERQSISMKSVMKESKKREKLTDHRKFSLLKPELDKMKNAFLSLGSEKFTKSLPEIKNLSNMLVENPYETIMKISSLIKGNYTK